MQVEVGRKGDDGGGELHVYIDDDGDAHVSVSRNRKEHLFQSTEFCTRLGGGRSPRTLRALRELAKAIAEDNAEDAMPAVSFE